MEYCLNGFGLVIIVVAIRAAYQIISSSITGKPLNKKVEDFITGPTIIYATGFFSLMSAYGIYMEITGQSEVAAGKSVLLPFTIMFIFSSILFYGGVTRILRKRKH